MDANEIRPLSKDDLVLSDFDGTISVIDTGIAVIDALDLDEAWEIEHLWRRGEIGSMECLARQWAMVTLPERDLYALLDSFQLREDFTDFFHFVKQRRASIAVLSDGLDIYVDHMLHSLGFETCEGDMVLEKQYHCIPRYVNEGVITQDKGVQVRFPHRSDECQQCGNCKLDILLRLQPHFERIIYIGDGYSDMCPAQYADVLFATDHLAEDARERDRDYVPFDDFTDVIEALR